VVEYRWVFGHVGFFCACRKRDSTTVKQGQGRDVTNSHIARTARARLAIRETEPGPFFEEDLTMLQLAIVLLVIALLAALLGFGGLAGSFVGLAKIVFFVFLVLAVLSFFGGSIFRRRYSSP
jgi:uncharacterized membrane protein YtjA (UPF0391 family)